MPSEVKKKLKFTKVLDKYGLPSIRPNIQDLLLATNLLILEELKKLTKQRPTGSIS
jgi:hypothetical protein